MQIADLPQALFHLEPMQFAKLFPLPKRSIPA
jgi:hypothetical protein